MCGILTLAALGDEQRLPHSPDEIDVLRDTLTARGPDAGATWWEPSQQVALMHRRLRVIDLEGSAQPMRSTCGRYALTYNGEIYNFRELRTELEAAGYVFTTRGDTEVVLQSSHRGIAV